MQINIEKLKKTPDNLLLSEFPGYTREFLRQLKRGEERLAGPRILLLDIETAPVQALTWGIHQQEIGINQIISDWFVLTWQAKELFSDTVMGDTVTPVESLMGKDKRIMESLLSVINQYDIVVGHNCLDVNTPVLKTDLTWCKAGELKEGDKLVGFEEDKSPKKPRQIRESIVTSNFIRKVPTLKVTLSNGDEIIATPDHKWLKLSAHGRDYRWCETQKLKVGQRIEKFMTPWERNNSYESGWLSGFITGEGTLKGDVKMGQCCTSIDFCQRPGVTLNKAMKYCKKLGFDMSSPKIKTGGLGRGDTKYTYLRGGKFKSLEMLGKLGIDRLINKLDFNNFGSLKSQQSKTLTIVKIEDAGYNDVAVLSTSTKTYFGGGYAMHNCDNFDIKKIMTRFAIHGLHVDRRIKSIDTYKIAKREFGATSNKLDYLCRMFGLNVKTDTGGFQLWKDSIGDVESCEFKVAEHSSGNSGTKLSAIHTFDSSRIQQALDTMSEYCANDVNILEELYLRIRSYDRLHPNFAMYTEEDDLICPVCGGAHLSHTGVYTTQLSKYDAYKCTTCGATTRSRKKIGSQ